MAKVEIAATIAPKDILTKDLKDQLQQNKDAIDIIELRIDQRNTFEFSELESLFIELQQLKCDARILVTYRTATQGGKGDKSGKIYYEFILDLIQIQGYDMLDIEWDEANKNDLMPLVVQAQSAGLEVVLSQHDFDKIPPLENLKFTYFKMSQLGADYLKLAVMPNDAQDVLNLLYALYASSGSINAKTVGIAMSELGLVSRTAQGVFGGTISYGCLGTPQAPGQIHVNKLKKLLSLYEGNK